MTKPQRRHHVLPDQGGRDVMETLCDLLVVPIRDVSREQRITEFRTYEAFNIIQCVFDPRDVSCNTCQHVWRNIKGTAHG